MLIIYCESHCNDDLVFVQTLYQLCPKCCSLKTKVVVAI